MTSEQATLLIFPILAIIMMFIHALVEDKMTALLAFSFTLTTAIIYVLFGHIIDHILSILWFFNSYVWVKILRQY